MSTAVFSTDARYGKLKGCCIDVDKDPASSDGYNGGLQTQGAQNRKKHVHSQGTGA